MKPRGLRECVDCGTRFPEGVPGEPWIDPLSCPNPLCGSDETVGVQVDDALAALLGETL